MTGMHRRDQFLRHDHRGFDVGHRIPRRSDQGQVKLAFPEQLDQAAGILLGQRDAHAGIQVVEACQQLGQDRQGASAHHAHRDLPAHQPGQFGHGQPDVRDRAEGSPGERQHGRADLGEPHRPAGTVKQLLAELGLQPPDLGADPRLGHVHPGGRPGEAGFLSDRDEVFELVKFHNW